MARCSQECCPSEHLLLAAGRGARGTGTPPLWPGVCLSGEPDLARPPPFTAPFHVAGEEVPADVPQQVQPSRLRNGQHNLSIEVPPALHEPADRAEAPREVQATAAALPGRPGLRPEGVPGLGRAELPTLVPAGRELRPRAVRPRDRLLLVRRPPRQAHPQEHRQQVAQRQVEMQPRR